MTVVPDRLRRLLDPATIAVVGGAEAAEAIAQCDRLGYAGDVWPVHPTRRQIGGRRAVAAVDVLPGAPDAALVAVDRHRTIDVVAALRAVGAGGVVCFASGFAEVGREGALLQERLRVAAGDMPLLGPNCHGFVNALSGAALWPDAQGCLRVGRGVAVVTQSGNLALSITMRRRGPPVAQVITVGNQAGVRLEDCVAVLASDPRITAIGLHVEQLTDPVAFGRAAIRAWDHHTPIVVLQTGVSTEGAVLARTHTASLTGRTATYRSLFARYDVAVVHSAPAFVGALAVLHAYGRLGGTRAISLSCSGGEAALVADRGHHHGVTFPVPPPDVAAGIARALDQRVAVTNPLDYHTFQWGDRAALERVFTAALRGPVDVGLLVVDFPGADHDARSWQVAVDAVVAAQRATGVPVVVTAVLPENLPASVSAELADSGVPAVGDVDTALAAVAAAGRRGGRPALHRGASTDLPRALRRRDPPASRALLVGGGVLVPPGRFCTRAEIGAVAEEVGYPVTVKATEHEHKTDIGGVAVDLRTAAEVRAAVAAMMDLGDRFLVERHVPEVVAELLVGVRREGAIGYSVTIGAGGLLVDLLDDLVTLLAPVRRDEVMAALATLKVGRVLSGHRSRPAGDVVAAADAICRIVAIATSDPTVVELEVNPLLVLTEGVRAVDVLVLETSDMAGDDP
ncbi:MAG TPA: acetate--CoA ligase family protein [Euzebyales bacterium]